ncbi:MAG: metallophosphoesterase [Dehalococcoidales bacterium]|jgi:DNA repair exonuclease SbcCD nuclease subunit|nr:metallophosphoesterase [Dehalococcoidales bacterium]
MKIAVTADVHLTSEGQCPERYQALKAIMEALKQEGINNLIIAGDLFNRDFANYSEFDNLCANYPGLSLHIIPGNHDPSISKKAITASNVNIYTETTPVPFDSITVLFVPYKSSTTMYEQASPYMEALEGSPWILIGHGDYYDGVKEVNPLEKGTYMPLSRENIDALRPQKVILGHIHKRMNRGNVFYCGSPCGLDINETGKRFFLVFDTTDGHISEREVPGTPLYFNETFVLVPSENEVEHCCKQIRKRIAGWVIGKQDMPRVVVRVTAKGYCMDKSTLLDAIREEFKGYKFYDDHSPLADELSVSADPQLKTIAERTMQLIDEAEWDLVDGEPDKESVKIFALNTIYGGCV